MVSVLVIRKFNDIKIVLEDLCHLAIIVFFTLWGVCVSLCVCISCSQMLNLHCIQVALYE